MIAQMGHGIGRNVTPSEKKQIEAAKAEVRKLAWDGPLKTQFDQADGCGTGGSSDNGNTVDHCLSDEHVWDFAALFNPEDEDTHLEIMMAIRDFAVALGVLNSTRKVKVMEYREFCHGVMKTFLRVFPWCSFSKTVHKFFKLYSKI